MTRNRTCGLVDCDPGPWPIPESVKDYNRQFSNIHLNSDGLLAISGPFRIEPLQCLYPTSGQYAPALRIGFYALCLLSLHFRKRFWISQVTMGIVMSYSSIAATHAIILVAGRKIMTSAAVEVISVSKTNDIKIPIYPQVWDEDTDAVLAITGTAFLAMAPLALWSDTVQQIIQRKPLTTSKELDPEELFQSNLQPVLRAQWKKRLVLIAWFFLLLIGNICAWVNEIYVDTHSVEQFRICITEEKLPDLMSHSSLNQLGGKIAGKSLNETLWDMVASSVTAQSKIPICVYPCFSAPGHRQDARAIPSKGAWPSISNYSNPRPGWALMLVSMVLIGTSFAFIITIFILQQTVGVKYGRTDDGRAEDTIQIKFAH
ncbi:hypothetical protein GQ44DRAFT_787902 [Phaeosphaeriaceae sp. PMI808]|nr:hypothetical protein GQ44DRAFT_787902 [Phaeosphaeriaceae sp. PMI808]